VRFGRQKGNLLFCFLTPPREWVPLIPPGFSKQTKKKGHRHCTRESAGWRVRNQVPRNQCQEFDQRGWSLHLFGSRHKETTDWLGWSLANIGQYNNRKSQVCVRKGSVRCSIQKVLRFVSPSCKYLLLFLFPKQIRTKRRKKKEREILSTQQITENKKKSEKTKDGTEVDFFHFFRRISSSFSYSLIFVRAKNAFFSKYLQFSNNRGLYDVSNKQRTEKMKKKKKKLVFPNPLFAWYFN
jgi:hypothetical protein